MLLYEEHKTGSILLACALVIALFYGLNRYQALRRNIRLAQEINVSQRYH